MSKEFSGKVVLITGASSGIGAGTAVHFSKLGADLALTGRNLDNLKIVSTQCVCEDNKKPFIIQADVTNQDDIKRIIDSTIQHFGKLDVLVNNAGIGAFGSLEQVDLQQLDRIFDTNVRAVFQLTKLAIPYLEKTKGNIINVSSFFGIRAYPTVLSYCLSKKSLDQFTKCTALEFASRQIRVNSVNPGIVYTDIFNRAGLKDKELEEYMISSRKDHPIGRIGQVKDVAEAIGFLASDRASFITGALLPVDGGRQINCK